MNCFKAVSTSTAVLFAYLFGMCLFQSAGFVSDMGLAPSEATGILARRAAMFMLGIGVLAAGARNLVHSPARQIICLAIGMPLLGLACLGSYELSRGTVNSSMLIAIACEVSLGISFCAIFVANRKPRGAQ